MGVQIPPWEGAILRGKGCPIIKYSDTLRSSVQKRLNRSRCCLRYGLGWPQGIVLDGSAQVLRDVAITTNFGTQSAITVFWLYVGYNFACMIASNKLFDSRGGFSGSSYPMKTKPRSSAPSFGTKIAVTTTLSLCVNDTD